jgi:hypothetical protein
VQQAAAPEQQQAEALSSSDSEDRIPPGCARFSVELPKPLGLVLEEGSGGRGVFVVRCRCCRCCSTAWFQPLQPPPPLFQRLRCTTTLNLPTSGCLGHALL